MTRAVLAALAEGATAITPNRRLARHLRQRFDRAQQAAGKRSWPTPEILPYAVWLESLWRQADDLGMQRSNWLLTSQQSALLWRRVISAQGPALLDPAGAAQLALDAWALMHAWGAGGQSWRGWTRASADEADDPSTFAAWADAYSIELRHADALDMAPLADVLAQHAADLHAKNSRIVFAGFIKLTPQQQRLVDALGAAGADIRLLDTGLPLAANAWSTRATTPREEILAALEWVRDYVLVHPSSSVGIIIEDLAQRRDEIVSLAEDVLCPGLVLPPHATERRPFEVSMGTPLADVSLVIAALDLIALREIGLERGAAAALLRTPYLAGDDAEWARRASVEREWITAGMHEITLDDAIAALERTSPQLAERWRHGRHDAPNARAASPREWVQTWQAWLLASSWPGLRGLDSAEYQARQAWELLLAEFATLGAVASRLDRAAAVEVLRSLAGERVFQPEGNPAPIQLLGILEGSGLDFEALWVAGLSADRWPRAPSPNPLLPLAWQRERNLPGASAEAELQFARSLTERFAAAAREVVFSSPEKLDEHPLLPSALLLDYPQRSLRRVRKPWMRAIADGSNLEAVVDDRAPPLGDSARAPGGAGLIVAQSDCPFRAVARYRLSVRPWPVAPTGLSPEERGGLAHVALAAFWNAVHDQETLARLDGDALAAHVHRSVRGALGQLDSARRQTLPPAVLRAEAGRLARVLVAWLALERERPRFVVRGIEARTSLVLGPLTLSMRLDRIDELEDGGTAIIDYKSGRVTPPKRWFDERPEAPQLALYALAQRAALPEAPIRALAYAQLRADSIAAVGLASDAAAWPVLTPLWALRDVPDWAAVEACWRRRLGALAGEIAQGWSAVSPRTNPSPCRACRMHALCRVGSVRSTRDNEGNEESADE